MANTVPHIHISGLEGLKNVLFVLIALGVIHIIARKNEGKTWANMLLSVYC